MYRRFFLYYSLVATSTIMALFNGRPLGEDDPSGLSPGHTWLGGVYIDMGGNGTIHYWLKVDENQKIIDHMVIKDFWGTADTVEPPEYKGIYKELVRKGMDFGVNSDRPGDATIDERFLREAYTQGLMTDTNNPLANTVPLRGYKKGDKHKYDGDGNLSHVHWRVYLDMFYAGDLANLIKKHNVKDPTKDDNDPDVLIPVQPIPEAYIWYVFMCIAEALLRFESVVQARPNARQEQDEVLAFIDMKPANMLLDAPRGDRYPVYPKPLVSDFGASHIVRQGDPPLAHGGTMGFNAPEMSVKLKDGGRVTGLPNKPLYSWTNVWQTGRTIECMMRLKPRLPYEDPEMVVDQDSWIKAYPPKYEKFPGFKYSDDLIDLVWRCQRFKPEQRPTPAELLQLIKRRAPRHNKGMEEWGSATWIQNQEKRAKTYAGVTKKSTENMKKRGAAGKLEFLNEFPLEWAKRYHKLDMDLPTGTELLFYGNRDFAKVGTQAVIPPRKPINRLLFGGW
jgi:serine/threonine protein kinase